MTKNIYNYQPDTGEFLSTSTADASPLEQGVFLIPAFATDIPPPKVGANQVAIYSGGKWKIQNATSPSKPSPSESLEFARQMGMNAVNQIHSETIQKIVGNPTESEKQTWPLKLSTAKSITEKTAISPDGQAFLAATAMTQKETEDWALAVLIKSASYAIAVGAAEKIRYTYREAVKSATDELSISTALESMRTASNQAIEKFLKS